MPNGDARGLELGTVFPQWAFSTDASEISGYAKAIEGLGYDYMIAYDHLLGVDRGRWDGPLLMVDREESPFVHDASVAFFAE